MPALAGPARLPWWAPPGFAPMEPVRVTALPTSPAWVAEAKWDGIRLLAWCRSGAYSLRTRRLQPLSGRWPELDALGRLGGSGGLLLDGELVVLQRGRPSLPAVLMRLGTGRPLPDPPGPARYVVFDAVYAAGRDLRPLPWEERRQVLQAQLAGCALAPSAGAEFALAPAASPGTALLLTPVHPDPAALWEAVVRVGWEGVVCKRRGAPYRAGRAPGAWEKLTRRACLQAVVGGYRGARGTLRSLLLGAFDPAGRLRFIGAVGAGLSEGIGGRLLPWLQARRRDASPFVDPPRCADCRWVAPELVVWVSFAEWTADLRLRAPALAGFSTDPPEVCRLVGGLGGADDGPGRG